MTKPPAVPDRVSSSFERLKIAAANLNDASDALGTTIGALDSALKKLGLGVPTWVKLAGSQDPDTGFEWRRELGYAKVHRRWGITIRQWEFDPNDPEDERGNEEWPFNDAPRLFRIDAVEKLPELVEKLVEAADNAADQIRNQTGHAQQILAAIGGSQPTTRRGK